VFCTKCGKENKDDNKYCFNCGNEIVKQHTSSVSSNNKQNQASESDKKLKAKPNTNLISFNNLIRVKQGAKVYRFKKWRLSNDLCSISASGTLFSHSFSIPIEEIISISKLQSFRNKDDIELNLSDGTVLVVEMGSIAFGLFNKKFQLKGNKPQHKKVPLKIKSQDTIIYRLVTAALVLIFIYLVVISSNEDKKESKYGVSTKKVVPISNYVSDQVEVTRTQANAIKSLVRGYGYSCSSLSSAIQSSYDGSFSVTCDNWKYRYEVEDVGGNWVVTVD